MERTLTGCTKAEPMMKTRMKLHRLYESSKSAHRQISS